MHVHDTIVLKQDVFNYSMSEWRRQEMAYLESAIGGSLHHCPACDTTPHAIHIDGNAKLYRYARRYKDGRKPVNATELDDEPSDFFIPTKDVTETVEKLKKDKGNQVDNVCGTSVWKAAAVKGKAHSKKDETGCMLATCRHSFVLKALDMYTGEVYAYPYIMQKQFMGATFIALDTMCKYWPWLQKVDIQLSECQKPFLSVLHSKTHQWKCQVTWSGRCRSGVGLSTGETTEQANSYLSRLGPVTRVMESTGRRRRIEDAARFWNLRKLVDLPASLRRLMDKAKKNLPVLEEKVQAHCLALGKTQSQLLRSSEQLAEIGQGLQPREARIEEIACSMQRLITQLVKLADSSKKRTQFRRLISQKKTQLRAEAELYCSDHPEVDVEAIVTAADNMKFPWSTRSCGLHLSPELLTAIEDCHLLHRTQEEVEVLEAERSRVIRGWVGRWHDMQVARKVSPLLETLVANCRMMFPEHWQEAEFSDIAQLLADTDSDESDCDSASEEDES